MENLITGAEALMRSLEHQGVKTIFGYPGGSIMPVFDATRSPFAEVWLSVRLPTPLRSVLT